MLGLSAVQKQRAKQLVRRIVGEPYVGKRLKQIWVKSELRTLGLRPVAILDAGTEDATFVYWLADMYPDAMVTAVDIDAAAIQACLDARPVSYARRVQFLSQPFAELPSEAFDLITVFDVLEHIEDDQAAVGELARALRPGGSLLVHVPRDRWRTWSGEIRVVADEEAWRINPGHVRMGYSPESMRALLKGAGLDVADVQTWLGRLGVVAHSVYGRLEHPAPLRIISLPVTIVAAHLELRRRIPDGNTVFARAVKRG
jgi:2-polyprenyl-3-methyl-5-hydroxy-6-metoxy-1,4-benzoquinol methylase